MLATTPELDGDGPVWLQIRRALAGRILEGKWKPGDKIPAETELTELYRASRMTVHKAIQSLAYDGLVERKRRRGTVVRERAHEHPVFEIWDIAAEVRRAGGDYSFNIHQRELIDGQSERGSLAGLDPGEPLLWLLAEHYADGAPVQLEERLINTAAAPGVTRQTFRRTPPSEWLLRNVPWSEAEHAIVARQARGRTAKLLKVEPGTACLVVERQTWNGATPVTFARLWYPGERHRLVGRFQPRKY